jgi:hypothetical protein
MAASTLDEYLTSHCIPAAELRADDFDGFMCKRRQALLNLIATATGQTISDAAPSPDEGEDLPESIAQDSGLVLEME